MKITTQNSVYKITGDEDIRKIEKIEEKNEENSVIRVGYETFGGATIRIPGNMEILSEDRYSTFTSEVETVSGRIKGKSDKNRVFIKNGEIVFHDTKFEFEKIIINSRGGITGLVKGRLFDFGDII
jgi:translation initiation factor IF-1